MKPIKNQILFKPFLMDEKTEGGIIVPESYRAESDKGEIVERGTHQSLMENSGHYKNLYVHQFAAK